MTALHSKATLCDDLVNTKGICVYRTENDG